MSTGDGEHRNEGRGERKTEELFVEHYDFMFATARKFLKQKADAEDVVQSLYFKLVDCELPPDVWEDPKGYLYRTVVNTCFNWKSARKSRKEKQGVEKLEIAAMVGGSRSKISMILTRAREKLRKIRRGPDAKEKEKYAGT